VDKPVDKYDQNHDIITLWTYGFYIFIGFTLWLDSQEF